MFCPVINADAVILPEEDSPPAEIREPLAVIAWLDVMP
jgi:hypothetical protein